jgi:predicted dehydrogenase
MIHDIDIILKCVKSKVKEVSGVGVAILSKTPDIANARIEFENGSVANLTASRISLKNMRKTRFFQKDAYISIDFLKKKSEIIKIKNLDSKKGELALILKNSEGEKKQIYFDSPSIKKTNAILDELESFALSIKSKKEPEVTFKQATEALRIAELIIKSFQ